MKNETGIIFIYFLGIKVNLLRKIIEGIFFLCIFFQDDICEYELVKYGNIIKMGRIQDLGSVVFFLGEQRREFLGKFGDERYRGRVVQIGVGGRGLVGDVQRKKGFTVERIYWYIECGRMGSKCYI